MLVVDGQAKIAADYCSVFKNSKIVSENPMVVIFELNETKFMALNGGPQYTFSPANSYVVTSATFVQDKLKNVAYTEYQY